MAIVVAIALGAWAVWAAFRSANPKRTLYITADQIVPLLANAPGLEGRRIEVSLDDRRLTAPHIVTVNIYSRSKKDITPDMFSGAPLELEFKAPTVALLSEESHSNRAAVRKPAAILHATALHIKPALLTRYHHLRYTVLVDGHPSFNPVGDLADVTIRRTPAPELPSAWWPVVIFGLILTALIFANLIFIKIDEATPVLGAVLLATVGSTLLEKLARTAKIFVRRRGMHD